MGKLTVVDSIMGSGKTTWAKKYMSMNKGIKKYVYVSPYLDEITENILMDCPFLIEPDPKYGEGSKLKHFKKLLINGDSIVTTHALFKLFDEEVIKLIKDNEYILILDEVVSVIERIEEITKYDIELLKKSNVVEVVDKKLRWLDKDYKGVFKSNYINLEYHSNHGNIYVHNESMIFWTYPIEIFTAFTETFILTYLFKGQIQKYYYDFFKIEVTYKSVKKMSDKYVLVPYNSELENRSQYKKLISIYEGIFNNNYVSDGIVKGNELSSTWIMKADKTTVERLKKNLYSYFRSKEKFGEKLWTTKKSFQNKLKGKGYTKCFIPWNKRATNNHQNCRNLAFVYNLYMNPFEKAFFEQANVQVDEELFALSNLLQWIWRSAIRKETPESINIYIPSIRMRKLLEQWLDNEKVQFKYKKSGYRNAI